MEVISIEKNNSIVMKQSVYLLGGTSAFSILIAFLFSLQHWNWANELLILSLISTALFISFLALFQYKRNKTGN